MEEVGLHAVLIGGAVDEQDTCGSSCMIRPPVPRKSMPCISTENMLGPSAVNVVGRALVPAASATVVKCSMAPGYWDMMELQATLHQPSSYSGLS